MYLSGNVHASVALRDPLPRKHTKATVSLDAEQLLEVNNSPSSCVRPVPSPPSPLLWLVGFYHFHHHTHTTKDT